MVSQPPPTEVGLVFESGRPASWRRSWRRRSHSSRTLWPGGSKSEWRLLAQRFAHHGERAWSLLVRLSQNCHVKGPRHRSGHDQRALQPNRHRILSAIEMHMPDGLRLIGARLDGQQPTSESLQ
jgi:hypothetical protein